MKRISILLALLCSSVAFLTGGCLMFDRNRSDSPVDLAEIQSTNLIILSNYVAEVGVLPQLAGRTVLYRLQGSGNVLLSDPDDWSIPPDEYPVAALDSDWRAYNGHNVWLAPREDWWRQQEAAPGRNGARWPPDPWLLYAKYEVIEHTDNYIKLEGPPSPVSGLQLTKEVALLPDGRVRHRVTARNTRDVPVSWGLWTKTRLPGSARCYVPVGGRTAPVRVEFATSDPVLERPISMDVVSGFFTFRSDEQMPAEAKRRFGKAYISPVDCAMAGVYEDRVLVKRLSRVYRQAIHPRHAVIEVYQDQDLLEMEAHGPYVTLQPGESTSFMELWAAYRYEGRNDPAEETEFLNSLRVFEFPVGF